MENKSWIITNEKPISVSKAKLDLWNNGEWKLIIPELYIPSAQKIIETIRPEIIKNIS